MAEIFWETIAQYNRATWPFQLILVLAGIVLTILMYVKPTRIIKILMKTYIILLNCWIAVVYYIIFCEPRNYNYIPAIFWGIMAIIWLFDLLRIRTDFERTYIHNKYTIWLYLLPFIYPVVSLIKGAHFPEIISPVMPCSVAVLTLGVLLAFARRANLLIILILFHWAVIGLAKVYYYGIPEDLLLTGSTVPALYFFLKDYIDRKMDVTSKPSAKTANILLIILCGIIAIFFAAVVLKVFFPEWAI